MMTMSGAGASISVDRARALAAQLLAAELPGRWRHTAAVAHRGGQLARTVPAHDRALLVAAAWLHDVGYATPARDSGFHPLDGARLLDRHGWPARLSALVAHHSGAWYVARVRGLAEQLGAYPREQSPVADALTYADQTIGPTGLPMPIDQRMADMLARHGPDSPNARAHPDREPYLLQVAQRVETRLAH
jgi:putative nucleotidyltransferase with HDIG domain